MKQVLLALCATAALAAKAEDLVNLISLAVTNMVETTYSDDNGSVVTNIPSVVFGAGDFNSYNQYGVCWWDNRKDCAFDGFGWYDNKGTTEAQGHVEFDSEEAIWTGYQVSAAAVVSRIRFLSTPDPESDGWVRAERTLGCSFQAANSADFSDAVTLYTVGDGGETKYSLTNGWQEVLVSSAQSFTYLRFYAPADKAGGSIAEVEFYGQTWAEATSMAPAATPQNLSLAVDDVDTDAVTLTWNAPTVPCISALVIRSTAPGGSTFEVTNTLAATTTTYTDSDAVRIPGVTYYYRVAFANGANVGPASGVVSHRHVAEIAVTIGSGGTSAVEYDHDYNAETATSAACLFDSDTTTKPDVVNASGGNTGVAVGVDFGEGNECVVTRFAVFPSREWNNNLGENGQWVVGRSDGIVLNGSNDTADWKNGAAISAACDLYEEDTWDDTRLAWHAFGTTDATTAYRYVYLTKPARANLQGQRTDEFYGNVRELKLYGWNAAGAAAVLLAPEISSVRWTGPDVKLEWSAAQNATSYRIERKWNDGAWVTVSTVSGTEYADTSIAKPTKGTYMYRIASIGENGSVAYTLGVVPTGTPSARGFVMAIY